MNLESILALLSAVAADYGSYEAGSSVSAPQFTLDLTNLGLGKMSINITAKKAA